MNNRSHSEIIPKWSLRFTGPLALFVYLTARSHLIVINLQYSSTIDDFEDLCQRSPTSHRFCHGGSSVFIDVTAYRWELGNSFIRCISSCLLKVARFSDLFSFEVCPDIRFRTTGIERNATLIATKTTAPPPNAMGRM